MGVHCIRSQTPILVSAYFEYENYFIELISYSKPLRRDFAAAMEARLTWREASHNLMPENVRQRTTGLTPEELSKYMQTETGRMSEARPIANLRAAGILITLYSILEDLQSALGIPSTEGLGFGPSYNDVRFSVLLRVGANSARHGREWWRAALDHYQRLVAADLNHKSVTDSSWKRQQLASIEPIVKAVPMKDASEASNQPAVEVIATLSSGAGYDEILKGMIDVAHDIAIHTGTLKALGGVAHRFNLPN
jgi:hypothetical protein